MAFSIYEYTFKDVKSEELTVQTAIDVGVLIEELYDNLRANGLIKFNDPADDHPNYGITSPDFRMDFEESVKAALASNGLIFMRLGQLPKDD